MDGYRPSTELMDDFTRKRKEMVERQIVARGINDRVTVESFLKVPREKFLPQSHQIHAYEDGPLPIGEGQTISQPYIVALMTQAAELGPNSTVLEIGTGSGYQAAILSKIVQKVYTVERLSSLAENAKELFRELQYRNIEVKTDDGTLGWPEKGPYDAIIVTAGAPSIPESLTQQLKVGGRLVIPVGDAWSQRLVRIRRISQDKYNQELLDYVRFVPLIGEEGW